MNIGDPAMGGQDSVTISDLVTSQPEPIVKREKPKRPPPPIIMSEIKVWRYNHGKCGLPTITSDNLGLN